MEIALCLAVLYCLMLALLGFSLAVALPESEPYLAPERIEEKWAKHFLFGVVFAIGALLSLGAETALHLYRRKQKRKLHEHQTTENP